MGQSGVTTGSGVDRTRTPPVRETASGTHITAEIPAVPAGPGYGVLLPDGSVWYPGSKKKLPAPALLRVIVWIVAFAVLLAGICDLIVKFEPSWSNTFRHVVSTAADGTAPSGNNGAGGGTKSTTSTTRKPVPSVIQQQTTAPTWALPNTIDYATKLSTYNVKVTSTGVAWVNGIWLTTQGVIEHSQDYTLGQSPTPLVETFPVLAGEDFQIEVAHAGVTVQLYSGTRFEATVPVPKLTGTYYFLFVPASS
jgi:hypothetical protein